MVLAPTEFHTPLGEEANTQESASSTRGGRECDESPKGAEQGLSDAEAQSKGRSAWDGGAASPAGSRVGRLCPACSEGVWGPWSCCNWMPQPGWRHTAKVHTVMAARASLRSRGREGCACSAVCRESFVALVSVQGPPLPLPALGVAGAPWWSLPCSCAAPASASVIARPPCGPLSRAPLRTPVVLGEVPPSRPRLVSLHQPKPDFQIKPRSRVPGDRTSVHLMGTTVHPVTEE